MRWNMETLKNHNEEISSEEKKSDLETGLSELEEIVEKLSDEDLPLEEAFHLYESGVKKVRECQRSMEDVEKRMQVLKEDGSLEEMADDV